MSTTSDSIEQGADGDTRPGNNRATTDIWPIGKTALAALVDLGMSDIHIASYFHVGANDVQRLRQRYVV